MAKPRDKESGRFRIYVSDRSGFEFGFIPITSYPNAYTRESGKPVQDINIKVTPTEYDQPPPSNLPLGGQGDISSSDVRANSDPAVDANVYIVPPITLFTTVIVSPGTSISWNQDPWTQIAGSSAVTTMSANPQVVPGENNKQICFMCVSNQIILSNGNGLSLHSPFYVMSSGSIISFFYSRTDNLWYETSRSSLYQDLGAF